MVGQPGGLGRLLDSVLAWSDRSCQVAKVVSDLEADNHVGVILLLGDHPDEESDLVGFPEGDHAGRWGREEEGRATVGSGRGVKVGFGYSDGLTLDHPGSPGVQPAHRTQPQHLCQPAAAPWWEQ